MNENILDGFITAELTPLSDIIIKIDHSKVLGLIAAGNISDRKLLSDYPYNGDILSIIEYMNRLISLSKRIDYRSCKDTLRNKLDELIYRDDDVTASDIINMIDDLRALRVLEDKI
jgi:hypothetical protein